MKENIKPTITRVLVEIQIKKQTEGGLFIPESATKQFVSRAKILEVGPDCKFAKVGQLIIMNTHTGIEVEDGSDIKILEENSILAIIE